MDGSVLLRHPLPNFVAIGQSVTDISRFFGFNMAAVCRVEF